MPQLLQAPSQGPPQLSQVPWEPWALKLALDRGFLNALRLAL